MLFSVGTYMLNIHYIFPKAETHFGSLFRILFTIYILWNLRCAQDNHTMQSAMDVVCISDSIFIILVGFFIDCNFNTGSLVHNKICHRLTPIFGSSGKQIDRHVTD